ncbi:restriction endonuclease subunit S [Metasolibacillus meyeri]|uniref:Restriction endonuclease subunit S n=1 Tax=Metasolibacillus meyeri TaxID=1071052 RepID=A0AAW9NSB5_9BACL|nr:restriction endonuclease subunit S [Metasolibacillus meyeri]MEC1177310.1 restriction endonuclease subunit S [Metasolibacillus meyeri]
MDFQIGSLFDILTSKKRFDANKVALLTTGHPYVVRTSLNNGIKGYLNENVEYLNEGNTISFGQDTATMFYQKDSYFTGDKIKIMKAKFPEFNAALAMYFIATMGRAFSNFSWGSSSFSVEIIKKQIITLPTLNDKLAFSYMEEVIKALETERIETLEAYLTVTGLKDYQLSKKDEEILDTFTGLTTLESRAEQSRAEQSSMILRLINLSEFLNWCDGISELNPLRLDELTDNSEQEYPFYGQSTTDNGIIEYRRLRKSVLNNKDGKPTILIHSNNQNIVYLESPFYLKDGHGATSVLQSETLNRYTALYIMTATKKVIVQRFNYNAKATKIGLKETEILLPSSKGRIENDFMSEFIRVIEKLVIRDLVEWTDKKLKITKEVVWGESIY